MKKEKTKSNSKRRLLLLILLLVCTLTLLGGATYAWFTSNVSVRIQTLDLSVTTTRGIEISSDAKHWSTSLKLADLYAAAGLSAGAAGSSSSNNVGSVNQFPKELYNVSSVGNIDSNKLELFNGIASNICQDEEGNWKAIATLDANGNAIGNINSEDCKSDILVGLSSVSKYDEGSDACLDTTESTGCSEGIKVLTFDTYLKLDLDSVVSLAQGSYVRNKAGKDLGLKNTVRVAFVTLGTQPADFYYATGDEVTSEGKLASLPEGTTDGSINERYDTLFGGYVGQYGAVKMNKFGQIVIWEPNHGEHDAFGNAQTAYNRDYKFLIDEETDTWLTAFGIDETWGIYNPYESGTTPFASSTNAFPLFMSGVMADDSKNPYFAKQQNVTEEVKTANTGIYKNLIKYVETEKGQVVDGVDTGLSSNEPILHLAQGVTKVRVYIWIEGNDVDTINSAQLSDVEVGLYFTTVDSDNYTITPFNYAADDTTVNVQRQDESRIESYKITGSGTYTR